MNSLVLIEMLKKQLRDHQSQIEYHEKTKKEIETMLKEIALEKSHLDQFLDTLKIKSDAVLKMKNLLVEKTDWRHWSKNYPTLIYQCCTTKSTLQRKCKKETGLNPFDFFKHIIVMKTKDLLTQTTFTFEDISFSFNVYNPNILRTWFKQIVGVSPNSFRKSQETLP